MSSMKLMKRAGWIAGVLLACMMSMLPAGCVTTPLNKPEVLRVGVTADYPPLVMMQGKKIAGLEVELAQLLSAHLDRPIKYVPLKWREQIDALVDGRIDIVMSGLSMTREREMRVQFAEPYMKNALMGMVRRGEARSFTSIEDIKQFAGRIGTQPGTTADKFVREHCQRAQLVGVADDAYAVYVLKRKEVDLYLSDGHAIAWQVSENEGYVEGVWVPLSEEYIAWAMRRSDAAFAAEVNAALQGWKRDGKLKLLLERWLPYADQVEVPVGTRPVMPRLKK